jgi:microcystin-dependent protein
MNVPIGTILAYAGDVDGNARGSLETQGWLVCDGAEYAESDYPDLENTIGTYYGTASKAGMFKVPDLQGFFLRGLDGGTGRDPDANSRTSLYYGGNEGNKVGSYQGDELKSHTHTST